METPAPVPREDAPRETEAKFRLRDRAVFEARLGALGAVGGAPELETNLLLDDDAGRLRSEGSALRIRRTAGRGLLTFKGRALVTAGVKSRVELESDVTAPERLVEIFRSLGFLPRFRYEKRRTVWRFPDPARPLVVVDETPIGLFAEIEGQDGAVRALARELGVDEREFLASSYVALYQEARAADPSLPPDMCFRES